VLAKLAPQESEPGPKQEPAPRRCADIDFLGRTEILVEDNIGAVFADFAVIVHHHQSADLVVEMLLIGAVEAISVEDDDRISTDGDVRDPRGFGETAFRGRENKTLDTFSLDPPGEDLRNLAAHQQHVAAVVLPGLRQGEAPRDMTDADGGPSVGAHQE
jgi:hypothetical protein